ncbi:MAG: hypothetical protein RRB13_11865 [bacterium]|nr:hypothetical protein [bacterium]
MDAALVLGRLDLAGASYQLTDFRIELERQRAALCEMSTEEPVPVGGSALISLGRWGELYPVAAVEVTRCQQVGDRLFEIEAVGLVRRLLNRPVQEQMRAVTAEAALAKLAVGAGLIFLSLAPPIPSQPRDMVFCGSLRGALDQVALCFGQTTERWHLNIEGKKLLLLPGYAPGVPTEIGSELIFESRADEFESVILPRLRPFARLQYQGAARTVDRVAFDAKWQSMTVTLVPETT